MQSADVALAIDRADGAGGRLAGLTARERSDILWRWHQPIVDHTDDLTAILTCEPLAKSEISHAAAYFKWHARKRQTASTARPFRRLHPQTTAGDQATGRVVGAITPGISRLRWSRERLRRRWQPAARSFPSQQSKPRRSPAPCSRFSGWRGVPEGVLNLIYAPAGDAIGKELCSNAKARKISFTGSPEVGRLLMRQCSDQTRRISF